MLQCVIKNVDGNIKIEYQADEIDVVYPCAYQPGDRMEITCTGNFLNVSFDESQTESVIYVPEHKLIYEFPTGDALQAFDRQSWEKESHRIFVKETTEDEAYQTRNIAFIKIMQVGFVASEREGLLCF